MNTWERNPQDPSDDHDWVTWFADPREYRGKMWSYKWNEWVPERGRRRPT